MEQELPSLAALQAQILDQRATILAEIGWAAGAPASRACSNCRLEGHDARRCPTGAPFTRRFVRGGAAGGGDAGDGDAGGEDTEYEGGQQQRRSLRTSSEGVDYGFREMKCGYCGKRGHNQRTCPQKQGAGGLGGGGAGMGEDIDEGGCEVDEGGYEGGLDRRATPAPRTPLRRRRWATPLDSSAQATPPGDTRASKHTGNTTLLERAGYATACGLSWARFEGVAYAVARAMPLDSSARASPLCTDPHSSSRAASRGLDAKERDPHVYS